MATENLYLTRLGSSFVSAPLTFRPDRNSECLWVRVPLLPFEKTKRSEWMMAEEEKSSHNFFVILSFWRRHKKEEIVADDVDVDAGKSHFHLMPTKLTTLKPIWERKTSRRLFPWGGQLLVKDKRDREREMESVTKWHGLNAEAQAYESKMKWAIPMVKTISWNGSLPDSFCLRRYNIVNEE